MGHEGVPPPVRAPGAQNDRQGALCGGLKDASLDPIMENQMEKNMENEMETAMIYRVIW